MMKFVPKHLQDAAFKEYGETLEGAAVYMAVQQSYH